MITRERTDVYFYNQKRDDCYWGLTGLGLEVNIMLFGECNIPIKRTFETSIDVCYFLKRYNFLE